LVDPLLYLLEGEKSVVKLNVDWLQGRDLQAISLKSFEEVLKPGWEKGGWESQTIKFGATTVKSKKGRGTFQMTVEVGADGPKAWTVAAPGQSELFDSKYGHDQIGLFESWTYKAFSWYRDEMK
jgi:hypothetical protein